MEAPQYSLKPNLDRFVVPRAVLVLILGIAFFFGIYLNLVLLKIEVGLVQYVIIFLVVAVAAALAIVQNMSYYKALQYDFFADHIQIGSNPVMLNRVSGLSLKQDMFDKMFNTCTIELPPVAKIKYIPNSYQIYSYIQQLLQFNQKF